MVKVLHTESRERVCVLGEGRGGPTCYSGDYCIGRLNDSRILWIIFHVFFSWGVFQLLCVEINKYNSRITKTTVPDVTYLSSFRFLSTSCCVATTAPIS